MSSAKIVSILSVLVLFSACKNSQSINTSSHHAKKKRGNNTSLKIYKNSTYDIGLKLPQNWIVIEKQGQKTDHYSVNIFKKEAGSLAKNTLGVHEKMQHSYIAIWPNGLATELPLSQYASFKKIENTLDLNFKVDQKKSKLLVLKNGSVWGYFLVPKNSPESWDNFGFIYAQIQVENNQTVCFDKQSGQKIPLKQCDFLEGDKVVQTGKLNKQDAQHIRHLLEAIQLQKVKEKVTAGDLIEVKHPLPNATINSPLTIKGKAKGTWFFEGRFTVKLYDALGNLLAAGTAKAQKNWMTEDFVPFKATLKYSNAPDDQRGKLVFMKANPSGLEKNEMHYTLPVIFPPNK